MYERFHNLRERPFSLSPDPDYLYPSRGHQEALSYLRYGIEGRAGFIVITGEIGSGKTMLLQTAMRRLDRQTSVARIANTMLDARELLEAVVLDFGLDPGDGRSKPHLLRDLANYLVAQRSAGRLALLVIDEAQNLSFAALEEIRMLSNFETERSKLLQIALIGQPNLRTVLARPELEQLRQRVTVSYHLQALDAAETGAYVHHRLKRAAIGAPLEFPAEVCSLIHRHSQGIPRRINVIADAILFFAYGEDQHSITVGLTHDVLGELESMGVLTASSTTTETSGSVAPQTIAPSVHGRESPSSALGSGVDRLDNATQGPRLAEPTAQPLTRRSVRAGNEPLFSVRQPLATAPGSVLAAPRVSSTSAGMSAALAAPRPIVRAARPLTEARTAKPASFWTRIRRSLAMVAGPAFEK